MGLHPKVIDLSLERIERLLERLGNPQARLAPVVHVAGTNGKGSVIAFLRAMLEAAGYRTHVYISPHLVRFNERIRLAGELISEDALSAVLEECEEVNAGHPITFFEITTAAAMVAFSRTPADIVLLETGLGGRLDATTVIERPLLSVLTPVSVDHQQFLGDTIEEIAGEKAGILKPGVACVTTAQSPGAARVIAAHAEYLGVALYRQGRDWAVRGTRDGLRFEASGRILSLPRPVLAGTHQVRNAGQAAACCGLLTGFEVPDAALARGLETARWPGRLHRLVSGPLVDMVPGDWELWIDGGHNPAAARTLAAQAWRWRGRPLYLVFGMLNSKDPHLFLGALSGRVTGLRAVAIPGEANSIGAEELAAAATAAGIAAAPAPGVEEALAAITASESGPARVLICGSLYLIGTVLADNV